MSNVAPPSRTEWKQRIAPKLDTSLREVSERITSHPSVQSWLHEASYDAIQNVKHLQDTQAEAQAYGRMVEQLEEHFAPLVDAVHELTAGCGHLDLHWRPLEPNYSRVYINFGRGFTANVFYRLEALTADEATRALQTVKHALPKGEPFPKRPNEATGIIATQAHCLGVRFTDHVGDNGQRWQEVMLLPKGRSALEHLTEEDAVTALVQFFEADA